MVAIGLRGFRPFLAFEVDIEVGARRFGVAFPFSHHRLPRVGLLILVTLLESMSLRFQVWRCIVVTAATYEV